MGYQAHIDRLGNFCVPADHANIILHAPVPAHQVLAMQSAFQSSEIASSEVPLATKGPITSLATLIDAQRYTYSILRGACMPELIV